MGRQVSRNSAKCCNAVSMEQKGLGSGKMIEMSNKMMLEK